MRLRTPQPGPFGLLTLLALMWLPLMRAQAPPQVRDAAATPRVTYTFERAGLSVPRFTLGIDRDGDGSYAGEEATPAARGVGAEAAEAATQPFARSLVVSAATVDRIFALAQQLDHFNVTCASKAKNIADTGTKTLRYAGPDGAGSCTYNFSENKDVEALTEIFRGIAETMDAGRELDRLHRFDRLGLDAAMDLLTGRVTEGRALEVGTIEPSLRSIAADVEVIQRARVRASALLAQIPAQIPAQSPNQQSPKP